MFKLLKSNLREIIAFLMIVVALLGTLFLLQSRAVSESGIASTVVSVLVTVVGGTLRFIACLALAWLNLAVTFPEANRFVVDSKFDDWWRSLSNDRKAIISLLAAAVLALVAAICMAAS